LCERSATDFTVYTPACIHESLKTGIYVHNNNGV
jgi:hypothetical protein